MKPAKVGIIGCGNICGVYFAAGMKFEALEVVACTDLDSDKARARAAEFGVECVASVEELLARPEIEIVMNLTVPKAHAEVAQKVVEAGKSVYNEKPLAVKLEDATRLLETARAKGVLVASAPDTFLGASHQTTRKLLDEGAIGAPVAATAFMMCHGHESWHPSPEFYYEVGGGPLFDMGPYYLTALVNLLGPVRRVTGMATITFPERTITSQPKAGKVVKVETPTHISATLEFEQGAIATVIMSFDVWHHQLPRIELYGTEGTMLIPDPNGFGGTVQLRRMGEEAWREVEHTHSYAEQNRGLGTADMAMALRSGRKPRAGGELAHHVLEVMHAVLQAAREGRQTDIASRCERPAALRADLPEGVLEA